MLKQICIAALVSALVVGPNAIAAAPLAPVASVGKSSGKVMVNQGKGFVSLSEGASLFAGDKVFVGKDGSASITYNDKQCTVDVAPASVMLVQPVAPCADGETVSSIDSVFVHSAQAAGGADGSMYVPLVIAGSAIVLGGTIAIVATQDKNPVSAP